MSTLTTETTIQSNIKQHKSDSLKDYALFVGGLNVTHDVLANYDPLRTGYGRLFMVRKPIWLTKQIPTKLDKFKHILEYGNTAVSGISDIEVSFQEYTGGYAGKSFAIPTVATDGTNGFQVMCYEFAGSPIREVIHTWINGTTDLLTGLCTYNGDDTPMLQANQTAEFIYVSTDHSGQNVEYACLFANCFPVNLKNDHFNYNSGEHNIVEYNVDFRCTKYESLQINKLANTLLQKYKVLANSLNFYSGIKSTDNDLLGAGTTYDVTTGKLVDRQISNINGVGSNNVNLTSNTMAPLQETDLVSL